MFENITLITLGRFLQGVACCGFSTVVVPKFSKPYHLLSSLVYETAPVNLRGPLGGITQLSIFSGALLCFTLGFGTPETRQDKLTSNYWRMMFALPAVVALLQLVLVNSLYRYESPIFSLLNQGNETEARKVLCKF